MTHFVKGFKIRNELNAIILLLYKCPDMSCKLFLTDAPHNILKRKNLEIEEHSSYFNCWWNYLLMPWIPKFENN